MKKILIAFIFSSAFITQSCINDNEDPVAVAPIQGSIVNPNVGGATQPNQVWFDLSKGKEVYTKRTNWDIALYTGNEFKVILNSSIMMAAAKIPNAVNIDLVTQSHVAGLMNLVQVGTFTPDNEAYIDDVNGNFPSGYTAIESVKENDSQNAVYLVNMGREIYSGNVAVGSVATGGDLRGWMKIQVTRNSSGYKIKYAKINETSHRELVIEKNTAYNYNFVSLTQGKEVYIQPEKKDWDLCFTVFTNTITGAGSYVFADFVLNNNVGGVGAYEVKVPAQTSGTEAYNNFKSENIDPSKLVYSDHRIIGGNWRNPVGTNGLEVYGDRFYIIKDADGYYFKLKFTRLTNTSGERGFPQFEYKPL
ncbi:HmuY family protein [Chryseobacterium binzhouense]|uniref:HmuY family protein n=1 Tax=Chryseobacterium binzhouense TaxID=2593646 RepID=UPI00289A5DDB|nr:HmuY family protein [Chryseobacterium binzhouense]